MKYFSLIACFLYSFSLFSQKSIYKTSTDTSLFGFEGTWLIWQDLKKEPAHFRNVFVSDISRFTDNRNRDLNKLEIHGRRNQFNLMDGTWSIFFSQLDIIIDRLNWNKNTELSLDYNLEGTEKVYHLNYQQGIPHGKWIIKKKLISNKKYLTSGIVSFINFNNGIIADNFFGEYTNEFGIVKVLGQTNAEGFLEDILLIEYSTESGSYEEIRNYRNGLLISIDLYADEDGCNLIDRILYDDVLINLQKLENDTVRNNFEMSNMGFGILFNNGYRDNDIKLIAQNTGNEHFREFLKKFDKFSLVSDSTSQIPVYPLTRTFQYIYPPDEQDLIQELKVKTDNILILQKSFLESPKFILDREKSDSLAFIYGYIEKTYAKSHLIKDVLDKMDSDFFKLRSRNNFYRNGIEGLNTPDTIYYSLGQENRFKIINDTKLIASPDNLIGQIVDFLTYLQITTNNYINYTKKQVKSYERQATVDSLNNFIVLSTNNLLNTYNAFDTLFYDKRPEELPLNYKLYLITTNRLISPLRLQYINEEDFSRKLSLGSELLCLLQELDYNILEVQRMEKISEDLGIAFTVFSENPFYQRQAESKILPNLEKAGLLLIEFYIEQMLRINNCAELKAKINKIYTIEKRLKELAESNDREAFQIDRALRREKVPARIERILGL